MTLGINYVCTTQTGLAKPEKFDHLHLVYHFTVSLNIAHHSWAQLGTEENCSL